MTIKELYEYCVERNAEDFEAEVQFRDAGGDYEGTEEPYLHIDEEKNKVIL